MCTCSFPHTHPIPPSPKTVNQDGGSAGGGGDEEGSQPALLWRLPLFGSEFVAEYCEILSELVPILGLQRPRHLAHQLVEARGEPLLLIHRLWDPRKGNIQVFTTGAKRNP